MRFDQDGGPVLALVFEVQLSVDPSKRFVWPTHLAGARLHHRCAAVLVVITTQRSVAAWARQPIALGPGSGFVQPLVVGPDEIPAITDPAEALHAPELATFSAIARGRDPDAARAAEIAVVASRAVLTLPDERALAYYDLILASLSEATRKVFDVLAQKFQLQDPGLRRAAAEGMAKGKAEGKAEDVVAVIEARCLALTDDQRARILACTDVAVLDRWLRAAVTASSTDELFGP